MINKFQQGGATQGSILQEIAKLPQEQQKKIMTAFGKWAQAKGLNILQLQGNEQALEQAMGQFLQEMQSQQAPKARLGAKLNYIRELKGNAPEGMVVEYYKCGGQMKKRFVKAAGGEKVKDGKKEIEDFKKRKACGGSKMKFEMGGETPQKPKKTEPKKPEQRLDPKTTKKLPGGKYPSYWTSKERQTWERLHGDNDEGAASTENKGIGKNKCGGKAKKHLFGGIIGFQQGGSFKNAFNLARKNKQRYFNWTDAKGVTRMYNSKASENDAEYETFVDNMNEMSAQLPTDRSPKHLGWERNNPTSNELRGGDRQIGYQGTESMLPEVVVIGTRKPKTTKTTKKTPQYKVVYNMPMGAIEYVGRDGKQYWMRQDHSTGQYYYIDRGKPISYAKTAVPEGYIIPGTNIKITRGANIGKIGLGLQKKWLKDGGKVKKHQQGGSLNGIPFYLGGTSKEGILMNKYKKPEIQYSHLNNGRNPMWYRFPYPNQNYILSDNDLGKPGEGDVFVRDERTPGSYLGGTKGGWDPVRRKARFVTPKKFIGSLFNTWEAYADSIRNANGFAPALNRKVSVKK